jgi:hypothetical protein
MSLSLSHNYSMTTVECTAHSGLPSYFIGYIKTTKRWLKKRAVKFNDMCSMLYTHYFETMS